MRTFVAVQLDDSCRKNLADAVSAMAALTDAIRWVKPENLHLTLKFIGQLRERQLPQAVEAIGDAASDAVPFRMTMAGIASLPPKGRPHVIHAPAEEPTGSLETLALKVNEALADSLGVKREQRKFLPHVTLGRVKRRDKCPAIAELAAQVAESRFGAVQVDEVVLMKSDLTSTGPLYTTLACFPLGG